MGKAISGAIISAIVIALLVGGAIAIGLWELFWWLWEHLSISLS